MPGFFDPSVLSPLRESDRIKLIHNAQEVEKVDVRVQNERPRQDLLLVDLTKCSLIGERLLISESKILCQEFRISPGFIMYP